MRRIGPPLAPPADPQRREGISTDQLQRGVRDAQAFEQTRMGTVRAFQENIAPDRLTRMEEAPRPFFITGLPRSRTAWFAVVCTADGCICHHEPVGDPVELLRQVGPYRIGISDSSLGMRLEEIVLTLEPRTLVIERPVADVVKSLKAYVSDRIKMVDLEKRLQALHDALEFRHPLIKRISYDELFEIEKVKDALLWLDIRQPALPQLMHLNIQSDLQYNLDRIGGL